jgi:hypothetical protein
MPRRRRPKPATPEPQDPIEQFAASLRESAAREQARRERARLDQQRAREAATAAADHAAALDAARRELDQAINGARAARRAGAGVAAADAAWRRAKARVIELESGAPPEWARRQTSERPAEPAGEAAEPLVVAEPGPITVSDHDD